MAFVLTGDLDRVRLPPLAPPRRGHDLWRHTCFEAFVALDGSPAYDELNFAPSGEWAAYAFRAYREGGPVDADADAPRVAVHRRRDRLDLDAAVPFARLSPAHRHAALRVALTAVVEEIDGRLSYWALHHPPGEPDFHHPSAFVLRLAAW